MWTRSVMPVPIQEVAAATRRRPGPADSCRRSLVGELGLHRDDRDEELVIRIAVIQLVGAELLRCQAVQKRCCRKDIAEGVDANVCWWESFFKQQPSRQRGEAPIMTPALHIVSADLGDAADGSEDGP